MQMRKTLRAARLTIAQRYFHEGLNMSRSDAAALRAEFYSLPDEAMVDRETAAAALYYERQTLEVKAIKGNGPPYTRMGRRAMYRKGDVIAWAATQGSRVKSTAQLVAAA